MKKIFALLMVFSLMSVPGCGDGSDVPVELRAAPQKPITPENTDPKAPKGAVAPESPF